MRSGSFAPSTHGPWTWNFCTSSPLVARRRRRRASRGRRRDGRRDYTHGSFSARELVEEQRFICRPRCIQLGQCTICGPDIFGGGDAGKQSDAGGGEAGPSLKEPNSWEPFESEMEWQFASWAIREGIKLSSVDSALNIPGVSGQFSSGQKQYLQRVRSTVQRETRTLLSQLALAPAVCGLSP